MMRVQFNAPGAQGFEDFRFPRVHVIRTGERPDPEGRYFEYVKTGGAPYDLPVTACLLVAKHRVGDLVVITSDGEDWMWGMTRAFCLQVLGYGPDYHIAGRTLLAVSRNPGAGTEGGEASIGPRVEDFE